MAALPSTAAARKVRTDAAPAEYLSTTAHFHLTNYIQQGTDIHKYVDEIMGDKVGRSTLFGIPLQQTWSYENSGDFAPTYYLQSDAPLYYYSFTDAYIANAYLKLAPDAAQAHRPDDHGFQSGRHVCGGPHPSRARDVPGVFTRNRRVHDP